MLPPALHLSSRYLLAIILAQVAALAAQAWLSRVLHAQGYEALQAHYLAYLVVPPVLLLMLGPILREHRGFLHRLFSSRGLTIRLALAAFALGLTMRVVWWSQLVARVAFGVSVNEHPQAVVGPVMSFACPPAASLLLGVVVMAVLVPIMEETIHRGLLQSGFVHKGPLPAILISGVIFTVFHPPSSYWFVFLLGTVLGIQVWLTRSLWPSILTHASYNGLVQLDWRCLQGQWNPHPEDLPLMIPGMIALAALAAALLLVILLLRSQLAGARDAPATAASQKRSQPAR